MRLLKFRLFHQLSTSRVELRFRLNGVYQKIRLKKSQLANIRVPDDCLNRIISVKVEMTKPWLQSGNFEPITEACSAD